MSEPTENPEQDSQGPLSHSVPLFTIFGIGIRLDLSVLIIFALIVASLDDASTGESVNPNERIGLS